MSESILAASLLFFFFVTTLTSPPAEWQCKASFYNASDGCDCACGAHDPDCEDTSQIVYFCDDGFEPTCSNGTCVYETKWTCEKSLYDDGVECTCGCGGYDPDCDDSSLPIAGCGDGWLATCSTNGTCEYAMNASYIPRPPPPANWTCPPLEYNASSIEGYPQQTAVWSVCRCGCGAYDPDCDQIKSPFNCPESKEDHHGAGYGCDRVTGECLYVWTVPPEWECHPGDFFEHYFDDPSYILEDAHVSQCNCGCGPVLDPDCLSAGIATECGFCDEESHRCLKKKEEKDFEPNAGHYLTGVLGPLFVGVVGLLIWIPVLLVFWFLLLRCCVSRKYTPELLSSNSEDQVASQSRALFRQLGLFYERYHVCEFLLFGTSWLSGFVFCLLLFAITILSLTIVFFFLTTWTGVFSAYNSGEIGLPRVETGFYNKFCIVYEDGSNCTPSECLYDNATRVEASFVSDYETDDRGWLDASKPVSRDYGSLNLSSYRNCDSQYCTITYTDSELDLQSDDTVTCASLNGSVLFSIESGAVLRSFTYLDNLECCSHSYNTTGLRPIHRKTECTDFHKRILSPMDRCEFWGGRTTLCPVGDLVSFQIESFYIVLSICVSMLLLIGIVAPPLCLFLFAIQDHACPCVCRKQPIRMLELPKSNSGPVKSLIEVFRLFFQTDDPSLGGCRFPFHVWCGGLWKYWGALCILVLFVVGCGVVVSVSLLANVDFSLTSVDYLTRIKDNCDDQIFDVDQETSRIFYDIQWNLEKASYYGYYGLDTLIWLVFALTVTSLVVGFLFLAVTGVAYYWSKRKSFTVTTRCPTAASNWNVLPSEKFGLSPIYLRRLFDISRIECYCSDCLDPRTTPEAFVHAGRRVATPIGWTRFPLRVHGTDEGRGVFSDWWKAYHGTSSMSAREILNNGGDLLMPGDILPSGVALQIPPGHVNDLDWSKRVFASPSILYASAPQFYATPFSVEFEDGDEALASSYRYQIVFEVHLKPHLAEDQPFSIESQTLPQWNGNDTAFEDAELEWATNRRHVAVITAVMIREYDPSNAFLIATKDTMSVDPAIEVFSDPVQQTTEVLTLQDVAAEDDSTGKTQTFIETATVDVLSSQQQSVVEIHEKKKQEYDQLKNQNDVLLETLLDEESIIDDDPESDQLFTLSSRTIGVDLTHSDDAQVLRRDSLYQTLFRAGNIILLIGFYISLIAISVFFGTVGQIRHSVWASADDQPSQFYCYFGSTYSNVSAVSSLRHSVCQTRPKWADLGVQCPLGSLAGSQWGAGSMMFGLIGCVACVGIALLLVLFLCVPPPRWCIGGKKESTTIPAALLLGRSVVGTAAGFALLLGAVISIQTTAMFAPVSCPQWVSEQRGLKDCWTLNRDDLIDYLSAHCGSGIEHMLDFEYLHQNWDRMYPSLETFVLWLLPTTIIVLCYLLLSWLRYFVGRGFGLTSLVCNEGLQNLGLLLRSPIGSYVENPRLALKLNETECRCYRCANSTSIVRYFVDCVLSKKKTKRSTGITLDGFTVCKVRLSGADQTRDLSKWLHAYIPVISFDSPAMSQLSMGRILFEGDFTEFGDEIQSDGITWLSGGRMMLCQEMSTAMSRCPRFQTSDDGDVFRVIVEVLVNPQAAKSSCRKAGRMWEVVRRNSIVVSAYHLKSGAEGVDNSVKQDVELTEFSNS